MNKVGIIDISAESIDMILAQTSEKGYFKIIDELKEIIDFGSDAISCCEISHEKIDKTIRIFKTFKNMCLNAGVTDLIVVASEEIRESKNQINFRNKLTQVLDTDYKILSSDDDLYYSYLGAKNSMFIEKSLLVSINAYSTNIAFIKNNILKEKAFLPFGFTDISKQFDLNNNIEFKTFDNLKNFVEEGLSEYEWLKNIKFDSIIGIGDSILSLGKIDSSRKKYPIHVSHGYKFYIEDVKEIYNLLKSKNLDNRKKIAGLPEESVSSILASTSILKLISNFTDTAEIDLCGNGLREGVLFDYLETHFETHKDILSSSLLGVMDNLNIDEQHANQVFDLSLKLFEGLENLHKINTPNFRRILRTAALLHDSGDSIRHYNHHLHSFYVILNANINGLSHKELLMSAFAAAMHRNNLFSIPVAKYSSIINTLDAKHIEYIGIIIRIAEGLDRSLCSAVSISDVRITDKTVEIILKSDKNIDLELQEAYRSADAFKTFYKKNLIITRIN